MKKFLLLVVLVVLFFAQSSYAKKYYIGNYSGVTWEHRENAGSYNRNHVTINFKNNLDAKIGLAKLYLNNLGNCMDFSSKTYFNIDLCEEVTFEISSRLKKEPDNTRRVKKFVNSIVKDFCEDATINLQGKIAKASLLLGAGESYFTIKCPIVLANKKRIEEEKKLAKQQQEQQQIIQEQEAKAQEEFDSQQKKMDTCKAYGFEAGTEAFGNCIFKLMELELEYAKLENEKLKLEAQAEQAKLNNQAALANSLATQAQAANQDKALRIQQFGLAMQGIANTLQPAQPTLGPRITCNKIGNITHCY